MTRGLGAVTHPRWEKLWGGAAGVVTPSSSIRTDGLAGKVWWTANELRRLRAPPIRADDKVRGRSAFVRLAAFRQLGWRRQPQQRIGRVESLQSALTQTLGVPVSAFRKRNNVVSECRTNRVVAAAGGAERPECHLERDTHQTDVSPSNV
jgi:hypothetical protein